MRKKNYKGRCEKRILSKCKGVCRTYDSLQYKYSEMLEANENVKEFCCNVELDTQDYTTDFVCTTVDDDIMVREEKKFRNGRYVTQGIAENLNPILVMVLWEMIDSMTIQQDYLQVFNFSTENGQQKIEHIQEEPEYKREYLFKTDTPIFVGKVFVIDDEIHSTMLLATEY